MSESESRDFFAYHKETNAFYSVVHATPEQFAEEYGADYYDGGALPPETSEALVNAALAEIDFRHAECLTALTGGATPAERDTWKVKEEVARAHVAGTATSGQTAMLTAEADGAGVTVDERAAKIIEKADQFLALVGQVGAQRAHARAAIRAAAAGDVSVEQVELQIAEALEQHPFPTTHS